MSLDVTPSTLPSNRVQKHFLQALLVCTGFILLHWALGTETYYIGVVVTAFALMFVYESRRSARALEQPRGQRWQTNLWLWVSHTVLTVQLGQIIIVWAVQNHMTYGNGWITRVMPNPLTATVFSIFLLDWLQYELHCLSHCNSWLWRVHRVHHSDRDFDITTSLRAHPIESLLFHSVRMSLVLALGVPWIALMAYALIGMAWDFFTHANILLPQKLNRLMSVLFITPNLHRIHHSLHSTDDRHNFGSVFSIWDRLFASLRSVSTSGQVLPNTGVMEIPVNQAHTLRDTLKMPFINSSLHSHEPIL